MTDEVRTQRKPNWLYITPFFLTMLPVIRVAFRKQPVLRDRLFFGTLGVGFVQHAFLIAKSNDEEVQ